MAGLQEERYRPITVPFQEAPIPARNRQLQAASLRHQLGQVRRQADQAKAEQRGAGIDDGYGITVRFRSFPDLELAVESIEQRQAGVELLNVQRSGNQTVATVWIPDGQLAVFERKIVDYVAERRKANGDLFDNQKLIDTIEDIRIAALEDLWVDDNEMPDENVDFAFEAWISTPDLSEQEAAAARRRSRFRSNPEQRIARFCELAERVGLTVSRDVIRFAERTVVLVRGRLTQFRQSIHLLGQIAELRRAPATAHFFESLDNPDQDAWVQELLGRCEFEGPARDGPYVCILDTGVNSAHPLLEGAIQDQDLHTIDPNWGTADGHGHGTQQAGLALFGDLTEAMDSNDAITIRHRLESVKIIAGGHGNVDKHHGHLTQQAVALPEIAAAGRRRIFSMAVTSSNTHSRGRPSAWSSAIDSLASDWAADGDQPRLFVLSAGNADENNPNYPLHNTTTSVEDPGQSWNALTVGAITRKVHLQEPNTEDFQCLASDGGLSPYSSSSVPWLHHLPFKPDVVFEGGNVAGDGQIVSRFDSLNLLTAHHQPVDRLLATSWATSSATGLASRFVAQLMASYPEYWPETVRALTIHSAEWTAELRNQFETHGPGLTPTEHLLRHCGWGEPDIGMAIHSGSDSLTLIAQRSLQPFERAPNGSYRARDMHLHRLPWPREALQALGAQDVELRVTLSYFVEPNPGERGRYSRYSYASHGLRFSVQRPLETADQFRARVNQLAQNAELGIEPVAGNDAGWLLGMRRRYRGSLHHDRWVGSAAELASRDHIAIVPVVGWWKTRPGQERYERNARYSLVVSIRTPHAPNNIDLYADVAAAIEAQLAPVFVNG